MALSEQLESLPVRYAAPDLLRISGDGRVQCLACAARCRLRDGQAGACKVRMNGGGQLYAPWGYIGAAQIEPVEKKPFFHVLPGARACGFGTLGCNLHCDFCQNWLVSQTGRDSRAVTPAHAISGADLASRAVQAGASLMIATYNEPLVSAEWSAAIFHIAREAGLMTGIISNGLATAEVLEFLRPSLDLVKIDLKCFREKGYAELGGSLESVLEGIRLSVSMGFWVEIVTVLIPGFNDSAEELQEMAGFVSSISPNIPWHVSAFHPDYRRLETRPTNADDLFRACEIGRTAGLHFVYAGNLSGHVGDLENTRCPDCSCVLVRRRGYRVLEYAISEGGTCPSCRHTVPGIWHRPPPFSLFHVLES